MSKHGERQKQGLFPPQPTVSQSTREASQQKAIEWLKEKLDTSYILMNRGITESLRRHVGMDGKIHITKEEKLALKEEMLFQYKSSIIDVFRQYNVTLGFMFQYNAEFEFRYRASELLNLAPEGKGGAHASFPRVTPEQQEKFQAINKKYEAAWRKLEDNITEAVNDMVEQTVATLDSAPDKEELKYSDRLRQEKVRTAAIIAAAYVAEVAIFAGGVVLACKATEIAAQMGALEQQLGSSLFDWLKVGHPDISPIQQQLVDQLQSLDVLQMQHGMAGAQMIAFMVVFMAMTWLLMHTDRSDKIIGSVVVEQATVQKAKDMAIGEGETAPNIESWKKPVVGEGKGQKPSDVDAEKFKGEFDKVGNSILQELYLLKEAMQIEVESARAPSTRQ